MKICIVIADYYPKISNQLLIGTINVLNKNGIKNFKKIYVSGICEIPVSISRKIHSFDAFIALGCVIKGKTPHFNFISKATINSLMQLSITSKKPIGNGIITCLNKKQAFARANHKKKDKGGEAANAVLKILKQEQRTLEGYEAIKDHVGEIDKTKQFAVITRTNSNLFLNAINARDWSRVESMLNADASLRNCKAQITDIHGVEHSPCTPLQLIVLNANNLCQFYQAAYVVGQLLNGMQEEDLKGQLSKFSSAVQY